MRPTPQVEFEVPLRSGQTFCLPPAREFVPLAQRNAAGLADATLTLLGAPLGQVRRRARAEVAAAAGQYMRRLGLAPAPPGPSDVLLVTGHQPLLFHPGIWFKHLLVNRLVGDGVAAVSIPVDNDVAEGIGADVPHLDGMGLRLARETLVQADPEMPYEAMPAPSAEEWQGFLRRLQAHLGTVPLAEAQAALQTFMQATGAIQQGDIGTFLTAARRRYEGARRYAEVPVSQISQGTEFRRFALHLLRDAHRFAAIYNRHLTAYRDRANIRTQAQPFPDLQRDKDAQQVPFWLIRHGRRVALWVRQAGASIQVLADGEPIMDIADVAGPEALAGFAIRPRALTLTMFTRLCIADLFVHGIGGARYDRVTDAVIREYFGMEPPTYAVATATLHLPLQPYDAATERQTLQRQLQELQHNPDRLLRDPDPQQQAMISEKWQLIAALDGGNLGRRERREATQRIREINEVLAQALAHQLKEIEERLAHLDAGGGATAAATHRGYPYCFFSPAAVDALIDEMLVTPS